MSNEYDVVLAGEVFCDLVFTGLDRLPRLGEELYAREFRMVPGGIFITAAALSRLGLRTGVCTRLGDDPFGKFLRDCFEEEGLSTDVVQWVDGPPPVTVALSFPEDRAFVTYHQPSPGRRPAEALAGHRFRHLHVPALPQLYEQEDLLALARERGATVSLDCQWYPELMARADVGERIAAAKVDAFLPNLDEARALTGEQVAEDALARLAAWTPVVAITRGGDGVLASAHGRVVRLPGLPVRAVDTTGAGDAFAAGYIYGLLNGDDFEQRLRIATICGGLSATATGGATAAPRLPEVRAWLARGW